MQFPVHAIGAYRAGHGPLLFQKKRHDDRFTDLSAGGPVLAQYTAIVTVTTIAIARDDVNVQPLLSWHFTIASDGI
jgi:hypothetical protein